VLQRWGAHTPQSTKCYQGCIILASFLTLKHGTPDTLHAVDAHQLVGRRLSDNMHVFFCRPAADALQLSADTSLTVMGWGATSEGGGNVEALMMTQVKLIDTATCNAAYGNKVTTNQICAGLPAGGKDACQGDSGGPLIVEGANGADDTQVGIVSYGAGCGRAGYPGVYTDVRRYRRWVGESLLVSVAHAEGNTGGRRGGGTIEQGVERRGEQGRGGAVRFAGVAGQEISAALHIC